MSSIFEYTIVRKPGSKAHRKSPWERRPRTLCGREITAEWAEVPQPGKRRHLCRRCFIFRDHPDPRKADPAGHAAWVQQARYG